MTLAQTESCWPLYAGTCIYCSTIELSESLTFNYHSTRYWWPFVTPWNGVGLTDPCMLVTHRGKLPYFHPKIVLPFSNWCVFTWFCFAGAFPLCSVWLDMRWTGWLLLRWPSDMSLRARYTIHCNVNQKIFSLLEHFCSQLQQWKLISTNSLMANN